MESLTEKPSTQIFAYVLRNAKTITWMWKARHDGENVKAKIQDGRWDPPDQQRSDLIRPEFEDLIALGGGQHFMIDAPPVLVNHNVGDRTYRGVFYDKNFVLEAVALEWACATLRVWGA